MTKNTHSGADAPGMFLRTREERLKLLKSGFTGDEVESLYIDLNFFETVKVNWDSAAMNRTGRILLDLPPFQNLPFRPIQTADSVRMEAAPFQGANA